MPLDDSFTLDLSGVDRAKPDGRTANGRCYWMVRGRIPFSTPTTELAQVKRVKTPKVQAETEPAPVERKHTGKDGEPYEVDDETEGEGEEYDKDSPLLIVGVASSTSVDFYGTEMSQRALVSMAEQMTKSQTRDGIPYLPRHNFGLSGAVEWDGVIGRTVLGEVVPAESVAAAYDAAEPQFVLQVTTDLIRDEPLAQKLVARVKRGEKIGQSIGGWFTELQLITNDATDEEDEVSIERIIVLGVELDHLAVTRAPANEDSDRISAVRDAFQARMKIRDDTPAAKEGQTAHAPRPTKERIEAACSGLVVEAGTDETVIRMRHDLPDDAVDLAVRAALTGGFGAQLQRVLAIANQIERNVVPFQDLPLAPKDAPWDWSTAAQDEVLGEPPDWERYMSAHTWYDPDARETKAGYKLPIAKVTEGELRVYWSGVSAAMGALNGARGGADIPADERQGVYDHLVRYYRAFEEEPPPLRALSALDSEPAPRNDTGGPADARGSAPPDEGSPAPATSGGTSEEQAMTPEDLAAIRALLGDALKPVTDRIDAVEARAVASAAAPVDTPELRAQRAEDKVAALERKVTALLSAPNRVGRGSAVTFAKGGSTQSDAQVIVERAKADGFGAMAIAADRAMPLLDGSRANASTTDLEQALHELCRAAEADGLIKPPSDAAWQ